MRLAARFGSIADELHVASSNTGGARRTPRAHEVNYDERIAELVRTAPLHLDAGERIELAASQAPLAMGLEEAIVRRSSGRRFGPQPLSREALAKLLVLANAVRGPGDDGRNAPSGGGLGSVEIFCCALAVEGVAPGLYHFDTVRHDLALRCRGRFGSWLRELALVQAELADAPLVLFLTCAMGRLAQKYGLRGYRLGLLDAGHVSQNLYLVATALGLEVCAISGFVDDEVNRALELDGLDRCAVLAVAVGASPLTDAGARAGGA